MLPYRDLEDTSQSKAKSFFGGIAGLVFLIFLAWKVLDVTHEDESNHTKVDDVEYDPIYYTDAHARRSYGAVSSTHYLATQV